MYHSNKSMNFHQKTQNYITDKRKLYQEVVSKKKEIEKRKMTRRELRKQMHNKDNHHNIEPVVVEDL